MTIQTIIKKYQDGKLSSETDEKYAGGFWDLAGKLAIREKSNFSDEEQQERIYNVLQLMYEELKI